MATNDFIPRRDEALLSYSANFSTLLSANPTSYGCTAGMATTLATRQSAYATALEAATNPATRGGSTIFAKDQARGDLVAYIRQLAKTVQGTASVTDQMKYDLGVTVRKAVITPIPVPAVAPTLVVVSTTLNIVRVELRTSNGPGKSKRGKPDGVSSAVVFAFVGAEPPSEASAFTYQGTITRTQFDVQFASDIAPGAKVWLTACWMNFRSQPGPLCAPVGTNIQGGGLSLSDVSEQMKEAA